MKNIPIRDIMVPVDQYPCIPDTLTLGDAVIELTVQIQRENQCSLPRVALVFDEDFRDLRGLLRRRDIMRALEPRFLMSRTLKYQRKLFTVPVDPNLSEFSFGKIIAGLRTRATHLVKEVMRPISATIGHNDHILKAMCEMVHHDTSLLPVIEDNKVIGVMRSVDVLREIARVL
jgi:CBS domain-containing protein